MNSFFYIILFLLGIFFGSFACIIIYRLKLSEKGTLFGKSHCRNCDKYLEYSQLISIFLWLTSKGKYKYCKKNISFIYPILEISMGILFSLIGYFLIDFSLILSLNPIEIIKLFFWLFIAFITIVYIFYDILFLEVHEGIMLSSIIVSFLVLTLQSFGINIVESLPVGSDFSGAINSVFIAILVIIGLYIIMLKGLHEIWDVIILIACFSLVIFLGNKNITIINAMIGALIIFSFLFFQIVLSKGAWIGGGDLRIAILVGMILGASLSISGTFITYLVGSIVGIFFLIKQKVKVGLKSKLNTQIPFGPFLAIGFFITIFFREEIGRIMNIYFLI